MASSPSTLTLVLLKVICGWSATLKKSVLRRWPSRCSLPVLTLSASMSTQRLEFSGFVASMVAPPVKAVK